MTYLRTAFLAVLFGCASAKVVTAPTPAGPVGIKATDKVQLTPEPARAPKYAATYTEGQLGNVFMACAAQGIPETTCICSLWEFAERYSFQDATALGSEVVTETYTALLKACYEAENGQKVQGI